MMGISAAFLALPAIHLLLGGFCFAAGRGERRLPALRAWGIGLSLYTLAIAIVLAGPALTPAVALTLGNALITVAAIPCIDGVLLIVDRRLERSWVWAASTTTIALLAFNNFSGTGDPRMNVLLPTPMAVGLFLFGAFALLRSAKPPIAHASRVLGAILTATVLLWLARPAFLYGVFGPVPDADHWRTFLELSSVVQILCSVAGVFCLFWIEVLKMESVLKDMAFNDPLTGLPNRRATMTRFEAIVAAGIRRNKRFTLMVVDIDHFKRVNDTHGHPIGDLVLKQIAELLDHAKRREDALGRVGGEEFVVVFDDTGIELALHVAERMREKIASTPIAIKGGSLSITISGGLSEFPTDGRNWDTLFEAADKRLYNSKNGGRNRISVL